MNPLFSSAASLGPHIYALRSETQEIRLFDLDPWTATSSDPVELRMVTTELGYAGEFVSLSYTWGEPAPKYGIKIDGSDFEIRKNLHAALLGLRRQDRPRRLWVDAICTYIFRQQDSCRRFWRHPPPETAVFIATLLSESENISSLHVACDMRYLSQRYPYGCEETIDWAGSAAGLICCLIFYQLSDSMSTAPFLAACSTVFISASTLATDPAARCSRSLALTL